MTRGPLRGPCGRHSRHPQDHPDVPPARWGDPAPSGCLLRFGNVPPARPLRLVLPTAKLLFLLPIADRPLIPAGSAGDSSFPRRSREQGTAAEPPGEDMRKEGRAEKPLAFEVKGDIIKYAEENKGRPQGVGSTLRPYAGDTSSHTAIIRANPIIRISP